MHEDDIARCQVELFDPLSEDGPLSRPRVLFVHLRPGCIRTRRPIRARRTRRGGGRVAAAVRARPDGNVTAVVRWLARERDSDEEVEGRHVLLLHPVNMPLLIRLLTLTPTRARET